MLSNFWNNQPYGFQGAEQSLPAYRPLKTAPSSQNNSRNIVRITFDAKNNDNRTRSLRWYFSKLSHDARMYYWMEIKRTNSTDKQINEAEGKNHH